MKKLLTVLLISLLVSCTTKNEKVPLSFYYWRTTFSLTQTEKDYISELGIKKLYVRYFDVALKNNEAVPIASIVFNQDVSDYEIVPVIYIKNEVFLQEVDTKDLAQKIVDYIGQINEKNQIQINEIQFDCDWSLQSKENYFKFINDLKKLHQNLSATIRLHQIKYSEKTGVPEVQRGVLMYYNMGVISAGDNHSIYERGIAQRYIKSLKDYSLPLDIALPIFSWGVQIRDDQVVNLIGGLRSKDLNDNHFERLSKNQYQVVEDFLYKGRYLAKNDRIKIEELTGKQLKEMVTDLRKSIKSNPREVILYDLNENNLIEYEKEIFEILSRW